MGTHPWRPLFPCQNLAGSRRSGWRAHKETILGFAQQHRAGELLNTCFSVLLSQLGRHIRRIAMPIARPTHLYLR